MIETLFDLGKASSLENETAEAEKAWLEVIALDDTGEDGPPLLTSNSPNFIADRTRRQKPTSGTSDSWSCSPNRRNGSDAMSPCRLSVTMYTVSGRTPPLQR